MSDFETEKQKASAWFKELRDQICAAFEQIETDQSTGPFQDCAPGRFELSETKRNGGEGGGGLMSVMRDGRVFEKVGVNISTVHGELSPEMAQAMASSKQLPEMTNDRRFWASGISLVAHMQSPRTPAVHMNTRMFWTPHGHWFGGGADLNPMLPNEADRDQFHAAMKAACDSYEEGAYTRFSAWADEYFMIKHWNEPRGVGGIFYDDLNSGDWGRDFAFTQAVGTQFLSVFDAITRLHCDEVWSDSERETQLIKRGRYAEFNLVYDRGTHFGLKSGHDPAAVLMSLPPVAKWP